jgi:hypothetical protein
MGRILSTLLAKYLSTTCRASGVCGPRLRNTAVERNSVVFKLGFRGNLGFHEGVSWVSQNIDENLGMLYVFVIIFTD